MILWILNDCVGFSDVSGSSTSIWSPDWTVTWRRKNDCCRTPGGRQTIPGNNTFPLHVVVQSGLQRVKAKVPFPQCLQPPTTSLNLLWKYQKRRKTRLCGFTVGFYKAHTAFGRDIILYRYRTLGVANGNKHLLLHATAHSGLKGVNAYWLLCNVTQEVNCWLADITRKLWQKCTLEWCAARVNLRERAHPHQGVHAAPFIHSCRRFFPQQNSPGTHFYDDFGKSRRPVTFGVNTALDPISSSSLTTTEQ